MFGLVSKNDKTAGETQSRPASAGSGGPVLTISDESLSVCDGFVPDDADVLSGSSVASGGRMSPFLICGDEQNSEFCDEEDGQGELMLVNSPSLIHAISNLDLGEGEEAVQEKVEPVPRSYSSLKPWMRGAGVVWAGVLFSALWYLFSGLAYSVQSKDASLLYSLSVYDDRSIRTEGIYKGKYLVDFDHGTAIPLQEGVGGAAIALLYHCKVEAERVTKQVATFVYDNTKRYGNKETALTVYDWVFCQVQSAAVTLKLQERGVLLHNYIMRTSHTLTTRISTIIHNYNQDMSSL